MESHLHGCLIAVTACYEHIAGLIQCLDDTLLYFLVLLIIQCIDPDGFPENSLEIRPNLWFGKGNDGKAGLVSRHILIYNLPGFIGISQGQRLLMGVEGQGRFFILRSKAFLTKCLHQGRARAPGGFLPVGLIGGPQNGQLPLLKSIAHIKGAVITMVIIVLFVGRCAVISPAPVRPAVHGLHRCPVTDGFKSHLPEVLHRPADHPLKAQLEFHHNGPFFLQVPAHDLKPLPESFRISGCHLVNGLLGKTVHERGKLYLCLRNIFPIGIEIPQISQIPLHHDICSKGKGRIQSLPNPPVHGDLRIIADKPVQGILNQLLQRRIFSLLPCLGKKVIHFQEQLIQYGDIHKPHLKGIYNISPDFRIEKG